MSTSPRTPNPSSSTQSSKLDEVCPRPPPQDIFPTPTINLRKKARGSPAPMKLFEFKRAASTPLEIAEVGRMRDIKRGAPGDLPTVASLQINWDRQQLSKQRSQYYGEALAQREVSNCPKERVQKDSAIIAEIKVNCTLDDTSLISDLSFHLAQSYHRPDSCIMVLVQEAAPIMFAGNDEPAYLLTITALPSEIAPTKNKRITTLTQDFLYDTVGVPASRGVIRFIPIAEENLATNGMTTLGEIEQLTRQSDEENRLFLRTWSKNKCRKSHRDLKPALFENTKPFSGITSRLTPPDSKEGSSEQKSATSQVGDTGKMIKKRKSFLAFFR